MAVPELAPATLSRRTVLRAAALAAGALVLGPACSSSGPTEAADPLRALGRDLDAGPHGSDLRARAAELGAAVDDARDEAAVRAALARLEADSRADFAARRTVVGRGWVLSRTEAATLVAYARSGP